MLTRIRNAQAAGKADVTMPGSKAKLASNLILGLNRLALAEGLVFAEALGLVQRLTGGKTSILAGKPNWDWVDPLVVALPISILVAIIVSLMTKPPSKEHLDKCFQGVN